jgi:hypothetical protein
MHIHENVVETRDDTKVVETDAHVNDHYMVKLFASLLFSIYGLFLGFQFKLLRDVLTDAGWRIGNAVMIQQILPIGASLMRFIVPSKNTRWLRILLILTSFLFISFKILGEKKGLVSSVVFITLFALTNLMVAWMDTICRTYCVKNLTADKAADAETYLSVALTLGPILCALVGWENVFVLVGFVCFFSGLFIGDLSDIPNDKPEKKNNTVNNTSCGARQNRGDTQSKGGIINFLFYFCENFGILGLVFGSKVGEQTVDFSVKEILKQRGKSTFEILCFSLGALVACKLYSYSKKEIKLSILVMVCTLTQIARSVVLLCNVGGWILFCILFIQSASSGILTMEINKQQFDWMSRRKSDNQIGSLIEISEKGTSTIIMMILPNLSLKNYTVLCLGIGASIMFFVYTCFVYPRLVSKDKKEQ